MNAMAMKMSGRKSLVLSGLALAVMGQVGGVMAMDIDVGNPDLRLRWDLSLIHI